MQAKNHWKLGKMFYPREVIVLSWKSIFSYLLSFANLEARELDSRTAVIGVVPFSFWWPEQGSWQQAH